MMLAVEQFGTATLPPPVTHDAPWWLEWHLENWARWMRGGGEPEALPHEASGLQNYSSFDAEPWGAWEALDERLAQQVNAAVNDLAPAEQAAICHAYLHAVYRFPRDNYEAVLASAKARIMARLIAKGVWMG